VEAREATGQSLPRTGCGERKPGLMERARQFIEEDRKKWGGMTPGAMARLGLAELREAFSLGGNIAQPTPYGMYGNVTPGEVGDARADDPNVRRMDEEPHMKDKHNQPTPSQVIDNSKAVLPDRQGQQQGNAMGQDKGSVHGDSGRTPTPSQVIDNPQAYLTPEQKQHGQEQQHGHEHEHGRGM
jgi:hypothetical protein